MWAVYLLAFVACGTLMSQGSSPTSSHEKVCIRRLTDEVDFGNGKEDAPVGINKKIKLLFAAHWRGLVCLFTPIVFCPLVLPPPTENYSLVAYTLCVMAVLWVTEAVPLPVTAFLPVFIFPVFGIMPGHITTGLYINDTIILFSGSLMLAAAVEQSGLHNRLALSAIRFIGYSHYKLLFAMSFMTMFVSMFITNTAATTMMLPIVSSILKVFESLNLLKLYYKDENTGELIASDYTVCYFCAITFSATIGGIGTLVGTATNIAFKGLLEHAYPAAPEYLSFPLFSAFTVPLMLLMEALCYLSLVTTFFGFGRPKSKASKMTKMSEEARTAAKNEVYERTKALGRITYWEVMVVILFGGAILCFFTRSPQMFPGWADRVLGHFQEESPKYIRDSVVACGAILLMLWFPRYMKIFKNCTAKTREQLPRRRVRSVLDWNDMDVKLPWSFMFLLGGGFVISGAAGKEYSNLNGLLGDYLSNLKLLPSPIVLLLVILLTIFITNFASNVATATVLVPIGTTLAVKIDSNPLLYTIAIGLAASFCYMVPVGTPGNLIVQSFAKISTKQMIIAGSLPTLTTTAVLWLGILIYGPLVWPDLMKTPSELPWV